MRKNELLKKYLELNGAYSNLQKEHQNLESFIEWLNKCAFQHYLQFCGLRKVSGIRGETHYIGFLLKSKHYTQPSRTYKFRINGYMDFNRVLASPDFYVNLRQELSEVPYWIENQLMLQNLEIPNEDYRGMGIGSAGISMVKEIAKLLHCTQICAKRFPLGNQDSDLLWRFYDKAGFAQNEDNNLINFRMSNYIPDPSDMIFFD